MIGPGSPSQFPAAEFDSLAGTVVSRPPFPRPAAQPEPDGANHIDPTTVITAVTPLTGHYYGTTVKAGHFARPGFPMTYPRAVVFFGLDATDPAGLGGLTVVGGPDLNAPVAVDLGLDAVVNDPLFDSITFVKGGTGFRVNEGVLGNGEYPPELLTGGDVLVIGLYPFVMLGYFDTLTGGIVTADLDLDNERADAFRPRVRNYRFVWLHEDVPGSKPIEAASPGSTVQTGYYDFVPVAQYTTDVSLGGNIEFQSVGAHGSGTGDAVRELIALFFGL